MKLPHALALVAAALPLAALVASSRAQEAQEEDRLGYQDTPLLPGSRWHVHDGLRPQPRVVEPPDRPGAPPSDAVVLFDGSSTDSFVGGPWELEDGAMVVNGSGGIRTKESFGDCQLHLEWRAPEPHGDGQHRGNSGVFLMGRYEVQILDCWENRTYPDGMTAALYGQRPPMVNACRPPGEWQSYDVLFRAPRFDDEGELESPARITVLHNGVCVHHGEALLGRTSHRAVASYGSPAEEGPISIQDHGNPVAFRNIWVRPLEPAE